ncbi:LysM peptidoglycan-binding domain-containing protein [Clostridium sp. CS001]|uniref:LysM peptidoglycan-binding domain-containing protein n=1 Tax=Clostridium sp. CS001 TaxID=2880648 RepID=UPI001CF2BAF0|nr:LysM peptidoglycan-binding domain-containing protein [Clostridium sp. CS001]MCB2291227.1 LysM peptidoglycan-binding domain-containing protein [Clostridium sp. CS001]
MRMKKGIITISTIAVVILGVFFAVRFIGKDESVTNTELPKENIVQSDKSLPKDNSTAITNENEEDIISTNEIQEESANDMDAIYMNDKTTVGIYTVKKDDTVFSIVKTYMPSHDKSKVLEFIKSRNGIDAAYNIKVGQKIVIPYEKEIEISKAVASDTNTIEYKIKKQDTLTSIARNNMKSYDIKEAIDKLKKENKITDENAIKEGTLIYIPK